HRLSTGPLDRPQGSLRLLGLGAKDATSSVCLEHDHAERVPDNIVELASDTCPLLLDSSSSVLLAVTLQHVRALLKQVFSCPSIPDRPSEHPRGASEQAVEEEASEVPVAPVVGHDADDESDSESDADEHLPAFALSGDRVDGEEARDTPSHTVTPRR